MNTEIHIQNPDNTGKHAACSAFIAASNIDAPLIRAVVRQSGGWDAFCDSTPDIASHGIDGGFHGFIWNRDTETFAKRNRRLIADLASEQASELGVTVYEMIRGFGCFRNGSAPTDEEIASALYTDHNVEDGVNMLNALAWYAGEEVARAYVAFTEKE